MQTFSKRPEKRELIVPDLDLPVLSEEARRPPRLTMDQYLAWNTRDEFEPTPPLDSAERCRVPFEL